MRSGALQSRDRSKLGVWNGPGSAAHHYAQERYVLHCARDKRTPQLCGVSMALLRTRAAFSGAAMNLMKAFATSACLLIVSRPAPNRPYSISSFGKGPRYSVPANGWIT